MEMVGILTNCILIILGSLSGVMTVRFAKLKEQSRKRRHSLTAMAAGVCLWCGMYGMMGFITDFDIALHFRQIGLAGVYLFLVSEMMFLMYSCANMRHEMIKTVNLVMSLLALGVYAFSMQGNTIDFTVYRGRVTFYDVDCIGHSLHLVFLTCSFAVLAVLGVLWYRSAQLKRQKTMVIGVYGANLIILVCCIPDTIFPMLGKPAYPSSSIGGFLALTLIWFMMDAACVFDISVDNLGKYVYELADTNLLVFDYNDRLSMANRSAEAFFGIDEKSKGAGIADLFSMERSEARSFMNAIRSGNQDNKLRLRAKNSGCMCLAVFTAIKDDHNEAYCTICFVSDLTREEEMIDAAKKADQAKSAFLAHMSHEIRTPINAVLGMDEMILRENKDPVIEEYAQNIDSAGHSLLALVNDVLDFSKIESGKMDIICTEYSMYSVLNDCCNMIRQRANDKGLKVTVKNDPDIPTRLYGDEVRIKQILINLLTNAAKYTEKGGFTLEVGCQACDTPEEVKLVFSVSDTGMGIDKENLDGIFNAFRRVDQKHNQNIEGTGLGLAITSQLVKLMNGSITVESEKGKGSVFTVTLTQKAADLTPMGVYDPGNSTDRIARKDYKSGFIIPDVEILVVDDVKINLDVVRGLLKVTEAKITTALSGLQCLAITERKKFDLILLDHMMPDMDGVETLKRIRVPENKNFDTPVVALTANAISGAREEYLKYGFEGYVSKPIKYKELEAVIREEIPQDRIIYQDPEDSEGEE